MKPCRKRQVEKRNGEVNHRCIHKKADTYRQYVDGSVCNACPLRVFVGEETPTPGSLPVVDTSGYPSCEFRHRAGTKGPMCGVTNLPVTEEVCGRCAKDSKMETARLMDKAVNYATAVRKWVAAGRPERTDAEIEHLYETFCSKCSMFDKERQVCNSCGCPASKNQPALRNKLRMATEECPLGQFGAKQC